MLKLSTYFTTWTLIFLLLDVTVTENKNHSKKETLVRNCFKNFREKGPLRRNDSISLKIFHKSPSFESGRISKRENKRAIRSVNEKTLLDYNGPAITKDFDVKSDQVLEHIRVKRSESTNNSLSSHLWSKNDTINVFGKLLLPKSNGSYVDTNHKMESDTINVINRMYSRQRRDVSPKNQKHKKHVKGNRRLKYHIKTQARGKEQGGLKVSRQKYKNTATNARTESKMKKRESEPNNLYNKVGFMEETRVDQSEKLINQTDSGSLPDSSRFKKRREETSAILPFFHAGKTKLRVRIKKITTPSLINNTDGCVEHPTSSSLTSNQSKYGTIDVIINTNITSPKLAVNFNCTGRKRKTGENPTEFSSLGIKASQRPEDRERTDAKFADEDTKYRAKRNQKSMSKRQLQSDMATGLRDIKNTGKIMESIERENIIYGTNRNRAVRSIEEIKDLIEKLVVKVNELQMYANNYRETPRTTESCGSKKTDRASRLSGNSNHKSEFVRDTGGHEGSTNKRQVIPVEERVLSMPSSEFSSRATRANSRRKSLHKWNKWTDWSSCSVTCGKGRQIRWKHCLRDCVDVEIEMEEKACQLPACPPGKFLGIF